jgi:DNA-binding Lrp family transcriptional regulator
MSGRAAWGSVRASVLEALKHVGPMTIRELAQYLQLTPNNVSGVMKRLVVRQNGEPRRFCRISDWVYEQDGARDQWRAVYARGFAPDAEKPPAKDRTEESRLYRQRKAELRRAAATSSSIWAMARSIQSQQQISLF